MDSIKDRKKWKENHRKRRPVNYKRAEEIALENSVFGSVSDTWIADDENQNITKNKPKGTLRNSKRKPAWKDDDDNEIDDRREVAILDKRTRKSLLKKKFIKVSGDASWAKIDWAEAENEDKNEDLIRIASNKIRKSKFLSSGNIGISVCKNLILGEEGNGAVASVEFHKQLQVALTGFIKGRAIVSRVDGTTNTKVETINFDYQRNLRSTQWSVDGQKIIASYNGLDLLLLHDLVAGKTSKIYMFGKNGQANQQVVQVKICPDGSLYVVICRYGYVHILSVKTNEVIQTLKMNSNVIDATFDAAGDTMYCTTDEGMVYIWNLQTRDCINQFIDEGSIKSTCVALASEYAACGSSSGVVNLYDVNNLVDNHEPKPLKPIFNLTTSITSMKFNSTSELLGIASVHRESAMRLFHVPSLSIYQNFPSSSFNHWNISSFDFSPSSGYLAIGNRKGSVILYRLTHYENY